MSFENPEFTAKTLSPQEQLLNQSAVQNPAMTKNSPSTTGLFKDKSPTIDFSGDNSKSNTLKAIEKAENSAAAVVSEVFEQAVVHTVKEDEKLQDKLLNTAKDVVNNTADTLADRSEKESRKAFIEKHQDACTYFGYDETTTNKFHVKVMSVWAFILNTLYIFTLGFFIISPITFILKKLKVVIKQTWLAVIIAIVVYAVIVSLPIVGAKLGLQLDILKIFRR